MVNTGEKLLLYSICYMLMLNVDRTLNLLWMPECISRCHSDFKDAFEMTEAEKLLIFGKYLLCHCCTEVQHGLNNKHCF